MVNNQTDGFKAEVVDALEKVLKPALAKQGLSVFKNHRYLTLIRMLMNGKDDSEYKDAAFSTGNTIPHNIVMKVSERTLDEKFRPQQGQPRQFVVDRETDFDKVGYRDGSRRDCSLKKNYNFDIAVTNFQTKVITDIIEVDQRYTANTNTQMNPDLRKKLIDCLDHIDGLEHAYVVKIYGEVNPKFVFCELVRTNGLNVAGQFEKDGFCEVPVSEICGIPTAYLLQAIKTELSE